MDGRQEQDMKKPRMRTHARFAKVTMMMMRKQRKGGLDATKGAAGDGTTIGVYALTAASCHVHTQNHLRCSTSTQ